MSKIDLTGQKYGRLTVVQETDERRDAKVVWKCLCDCGKEKFVSSHNLRSGNTKSCGCLHSESSRNNRKKATQHGHCTNGVETKEYTTWVEMRRRCRNRQRKDFKNYGGRGIKVCEEWLHSFENFLAYLKANKMYPKPIGMSIDRINNDGNYEPGNIKWSTLDEQNKNRRHTHGS
jgi:hypothetical protein